MEEFDKSIQMMSTHGVDNMLKITNTIIKIIQEIISDPDNPKFKRVRMAAQVMMYQGSQDLLMLFGFVPDQVGHYVLFQDEYLDDLSFWRDKMIELRKSTGHLEGWELPHKLISFSDMLGRGRFGEVYLGTYDEKSVAIKTIRPDTSVNEKQEFKREAEIMSKIVHGNVLKLVGIAFNMDPMLIVLELMYGNILELLQQTHLSNKEIVDRVLQVTAGMEYLHFNNIIHCDLAARNILLDDVGNLKISDFGLSRYAGTVACDVRGQAIPFPIRWTAPEVLVSLILDKPADIWSFGILFYEFWTNGAVPYGDLSNQQTKVKVLTGYRLPKPAGCTEEIYQVMLQCWQSDPVVRPDFKTVLGALLPLNLEIARQEKLQTGPRISTTEKAKFSKATSSTDIIGKKAMDYKVSESTLAAVMSKGGGLIRIYTANMSEFDSRVVIICKPKYSVMDVIVLALMKAGSGKSDPNQYMMAEVVQNIMVPGPKQFSIHILNRDDHPFLLTQKWSSQDKGMFYLIPQAMKDNLSEIVNNGAASHGRTAGYLVKFDENVSGHKQKARDISLWQRIWCVLDGSTLLCYRSEEDEQLTLTACESNINVGYFRKIEEAETKKRPYSFRIVTKTDDKYLIQANTQDDLHRWLEAIQYNLTESPSKVLQAIGEGEVKKTGYFDISVPSHEINYGKQWAVLKSTGLMQFFHKAEPKLIGFLQECSKLEMHNPTQNDSSFYIEAITGKKVYHLRSLNKEDHYEWGDIIHETMKDMRFPDKLVGYSQIHQNQGAYIYIRRKLSKKDVTTRGKKMSLADTIQLQTVIPEVNDDYGDFHDPGMRAMKDQQITANDSMRRLIQKNSHSHPQVTTIKNSESGESFQSSVSSLNENLLPSSASSSSSVLSADSSKFQSSYQSLPVHMHNQLAEETLQGRGFTPPPQADSPPPPPFPNSDAFSFQDLIMMQQGELPPPPEVDTLRNKDKRNSVCRKNRSSQESTDGRDFTFSQEIRYKASRTSKDLESIPDYMTGNPEESVNSLESQLLSALKKKNKTSVNTDVVMTELPMRARLCSVPNEPKRKLANDFTSDELKQDTSELTQYVDALADEDSGGKGQKRLSRDDNYSVRAEKPFSEKKALIANLFKKEEPLPLTKTSRTKAPVSSAMEERRKLLQGSMLASPEITPEGGDEKSQRIARMLEQHKQIQIMSAESRPVQRLEIKSRPRSQSDFQILTRNSPVESKKQNASPLASQTAFQPQQQQQTIQQEPQQTKQQQQTIQPQQQQTKQQPQQQQTKQMHEVEPSINVVLPPGWKCREENKATYYFNTLLGISTWFYDDVVYLYEKSLMDPGEGWIAYTTEEKTRFFHYPATGKRTWNIDDTLPSDDQPV